MQAISQQAGQPVIQVDELVTYYGDQKILDSVSLSVEAGEIMVIMGGSGSGKSTLLRYMLGLHQPDSGCVRLFGKDTGTLRGREWTELRKKIGVSFQGGALFNSMTVGDNVRMPLREHTELEENTIRIMSRMKLEVVNMAGFEHLMPAQLSGGMVKRAALARALVMDPKLLFFDEPSAGLDPVVAADLDKLILRIRDAMQVSIVVVTHELESAFKIADRITVLDRGCILMTGTVDEVRNSDNRRVRNLLSRTSEDEPVDAEAYLKRLTEGAD
ncbi:MAG: ATP-binding cassette domain-containing protein [Thermotogales bacterium]|nr:ATP-binding cassette domain-containing protein [Thermotogales bacterium]